MGTVAVPPPIKKDRLDPKIFSAFFAIYVIWGSTFLAIRIAVLMVPPWLCAGLRFFTAGIILYCFSRLRGVARPTAVEWRSLSIIGLLMFTVTYGALFWAEQYVPSGITSILEATLPLITVLLEVFVFRQQRFRWPVMLTVLIGFTGVIVMVLDSRQHGVSIAACLIVLCGSLAWCTGAVLTRSLPLPKSRPLTAGAAMMIGGSVLLILSALRGEMHRALHSLCCI
jgi:drug/metabolite transporter (DMT)-like permease